MKIKNLLIAIILVVLSIFALASTLAIIYLIQQNNSLRQTLTDKTMSQDYSDNTSTEEANTIDDSETTISEIKLSDKKILENTEAYSIDMTYPELSGYPDNSVQADFNDFVFYKVNGLARETRFGEANPGATVNFVNSEYKVYYLSESYISLIITSEVYSGGAHPNPVLMVINYDLENNKELLLSDLFKGGSNYLTKISDTAKSYLESEFGEDFIESGASANVNNFKNFTFDKDNLYITFDAYQVGPYAFGTPIVEIVMDELSSILSVDIKLQ